MMIHSYNTLWIHAIWSTKRREGFITNDIESEIHNLIHVQLTNLGCKVRIINGMQDHVHCLFLINPEMNVPGLMKQIKGSTSYMINQRKLTQNNFAWQRGYGAFTVSHQNLDIIFNYIKNQKKHHLNRNSFQEFNSFLTANGHEEIANSKQS